MKKTAVFILLLSLGFGLFPLTSKAQFYQGYQMSFGKSRVQYGTFFWTFYRLKRYDVYYYLGGQEHADFTATKASDQLDQLEKILDYKLNGRIQFILFNSLSDLRQSNIGVAADDAYNIGGTTRIVGSKVFLYFDGNHEHLLEQIRGGIAQILANQILYGGDIKDAIQNAALLTLPDWYLSGLSSYLAKGWSTDLDNRVKDGILTEKYKKFNRLSGDDAVFAGHSVWAYITELYGEQSISNLLYMTRMNRSIESGFLFVLGVSSRGLAKAWYSFYQDRYGAQEKDRMLPAEPILKNRNTNQVLMRTKLSPDGKMLAFVTNELGKVKINLLDLERGRKKVLRREGYKTNEHQVDLSNPLLAWNPDGKTLTSIRTWKGKTLMTHYNIEEREKVVAPLLNFEKILDFSYSSNGQMLAMSAVQKGKPDIFVYNLRTRVPEQITNDAFDDFSPRFAQNSSKLIFTSDRTTDTLNLAKSDSAGGSGQTDVYMYNYKSKSRVLRRITSTPDYDESSPIELDSANILFLSDDNGIRNRYVAHLDSILSFVDTTEHYRDVTEIHPATNYSRNILDQDISKPSGKISEIVYSDGRYKVFLSDPPKADLSTGSTLSETPFRAKTIQDKELKKQSLIANRDSLLSKPVIVPISSPVPGTATKEDGTPLDASEGAFQDEFAYRKKNKPAQVDTPGEAAPVALVTDSVPKEAKKPSNPWLKRNYNVAFKPSYLQLQVDNSLLSPTYQIYTGTGPITFGQGINMLARISTADLFENYKITGAVRVAGDFKTIGYFASLENLKKRVDKQLTFYREGKSYVFNNDQVVYKVHTNELKYILKIPFSETFCVRATIGARADRAVLLSSDVNTLLFPNQYSSHAMGKIELIFDNTRSRGLNLYNGVRLKLFVEGMESFRVPFNQKQFPIGIKWLDDMLIPGFDFRFYQKIHREFTWANRLAGSASLGSERIAYYLGSTDSWFNPRFNTSVPIDNNQPYAFQTIATNLRGFEQNIRNGTNFVVANSELRFPAFKYFISRPIKSDFIKNFQLVGFGDVGMAWSGFSPFDSSNTQNSTVIKNSPFTITLVNQRQPIVGGYGLGLRSRILGYFARLDWAWGVENRKVKPHILYFSLALDF